MPCCPTFKKHCKFGANRPGTSSASSQTSPASPAFPASPASGRSSIPRPQLNRSPSHVRSDAGSGARAIATGTCFAVRKNGFRKQEPLLAAKQRPGHKQDYCLGDDTRRQDEPRALPAIAKPPPSRPVREMESDTFTICWTFGSLSPGVLSIFWWRVRRERHGARVQRNHGSGGLRRVSAHLGGSKGLVGFLWFPAFPKPRRQASPSSFEYPPSH